MNLQHQRENSKHALHFHEIISLGLPQHNTQVNLQIHPSNYFGRSNNCFVESLDFKSNRKIS